MCEQSKSCVFTILKVMSNDVSACTCTACKSVCNVRFYTTSNGSPFVCMFYLDDRSDFSCAYVTNSGQYTFSHSQDFGTRMASIRTFMYTINCTKQDKKTCANDEPEERESEMKKMKHKNKKRIIYKYHANKKYKS